VPFNSTFSITYWGYTLDDYRAQRTGSSGTWYATKSTIPLVSGKKYYWEILEDGTSDYSFHGIEIDSWPGLGQYVGQTATGYGIYSNNGQKINNNSFSACGNAWNIGEITRFAFDPDYDVNGGALWIGDETGWFEGDPATGVNPSFTNIDTTTYTYRAWVSGRYAFCAMQIAEKLSQLLYAVPAGFEPLAGWDPVLVQKIFRVLHGDLLQRTFRAKHGPAPQIIKIFRSLCGSFPVRVKTFRVVHDQARSFVRIFRAVHQQSTLVQKIFRVVYQQKDGDLIKVIRIVHGTKAGEAVLKVFRAIHGLVADSFRSDTFDVSLRVGNQPVLSWSAATLSTDEGRFVWEAEISVHQQWDAETLLGQYDPVVYRRYGTDYHLIVIGRARGIKVSDNSYEDGWTVLAFSPAFRLTSAMAVPVTKTWPRGTAAKAIVQELCNEKSITLDWQAPEYVLAELVADKQAPIDIIRTVCNVIGVLPQSAPSGALIIRKETPVMPDSKAVPDATFAALSIVELSEQSDDPTILYNAIQVSDSTEPGDDTGGLQHIETDRTDGGKDIQAWSEPWAEVSLRVNSASGETTLSSGKLVVADYLDNDGEPEWVQFVDGKSTAARPVYQGFSMVDFRGDDPGTITWRPDSKELVASSGGEYYVQIAYKWRYYEFVYYSNTGDGYQLVLTDG